MAGRSHTLQGLVVDMPDYATLGKSVLAEPDASNSDEELARRVSFSRDSTAAAPGRTAAALAGAVAVTGGHDGGIRRYRLYLNLRGLDARHSGKPGRRRPRVSPTSRDISRSRVP